MIWLHLISHMAILDTFLTILVDITSVLDLPA